MSEEDFRIYGLLKRIKIISFFKLLLRIKDKNINSTNNSIRKNNTIVFKTGYVNVVCKTKKIYLYIKNNYKGKINLNMYYIKGNRPNDEKGINFEDFCNYFNNRSFVYASFKNNHKFLLKNGMYVNYKHFNEFFDEVLTLDKMKLLANYESTNNVSIKTSTFFDYDGTNYYSGGAERYLTDLYNIISDYGINMDIYQNSNYYFFRKYNNINVIGLPNNKIDYSYRFLREQSKKYYYLSENKTILNIFSAFQESYPFKYSKSIGISHGISWDNPTNTLKDNSYILNKQIFLNAVSNCEKIISVDTNTANWFQTVDYIIGNKKIKYIPNYVDVKEFSYKKTTNNNIVILYPRRLYEPRGLYILLNIVDKLMKKYNNIEIHFVGKGNKEDTDKIDKYVKKYKGKVLRYYAEPEKMNEIYKKANISLIPTLYSEGTSLSCLEAMASGNIVIATRVGGLTNLIIDKLNGYLIEPNEDDLLNKISFVIDNYNSQSDVIDEAIKTAKCFSKEEWQKKWKKELECYLKDFKSNNNELIEIYVHDVDKISKKILNIIQNELLKGNLVYIYGKKKVEKELSFGLLQFLPEKNIYSNPSKKYYDEINKGETYED